MGREAIRHWLMEIRPNHMLLEDPLRTKVQSFQLLSHDEQLEWIQAAQIALQEKLEDVRRYSETVSVPYKAAVVDNAVTAIRSRIAWLSRIHKSITENPE